MRNRFFFTTGNTKGVGLEIALKAFLHDENTEDIKVILCSEEELFNHSKIYNFDIQKLNYANNLSDPLDEGLYFYTKETPLEWFTSSVDCSFKNPNNSALITGPLSKDHFLDPKIKGHTSYLEHQFKDHDLFMTFLGSIYNCLLLTDHLPLLKLDAEIIRRRLNKALTMLSDLKGVLNLRKPIGVLGLNPHAGEKGLIGEEEIEIHKPLIENFENVEGPLSGDGFFSKEAYEKYSMLIANYHDQGLIPFKLLHGFSGCQTTLGLPFVRTSVNHGTAEELYLKDMANENSLLEAYSTAKKLLKWRSSQNEI